MPDRLVHSSIRYVGILMFVYAIAIPVPSAHADGGRGPEPSLHSKPSTSASTSQAPAISYGKKKSATAQTEASTSPKPKRQSRKPAPRIVESAPSGQPPAGESRFVVDEVIVRFQLSSTPGAQLRAIRGLGMTHLNARTFFLAGVTVHRYRLPAGIGVQEAITQLEANAAVVNAQPNYLYFLQQDQSINKLPQFGNDRVHLSDAHATTKGANIRIAIIDTAIDGTHPEFSNSNISSFDVTDDGGNVDPHGTSIAGILAADAKLTGVTPEAEIISIAAFSKDASGNTVGNTWTVLEATNVALKQGVDILNMSFAGPADPLLEQAMNGAKKQNILPVAAAGNEGPEAATLFPAGYDAVIAVTALDSENKIYSRANIGEHVDLSAPGVGLLVLGNSSGFRTSSGTSMATAYVSGIAALILSANPGADYSILRSMLENSSTDLGEPGKDRVFGSGIPNAAVAIVGLNN
ncbi:S8 family peptidase [Roseovarius pelagicus]